MLKGYVYEHQTCNIRIHLDIETQNIIYRFYVEHLVSDLCHNVGSYINI